MDQGEQTAKGAGADTPPKERDWSNLREWANVFVAAAALFVSIISIWFTVQISGLEDYFQSEISRRNAELDDASLEGRQLAERVERNTRRLEDLRAITDRYSAASVEAQFSLMDSRDKLFQSNAGLQTAQERLGQLEAEIGAREGELDAFRRSEVYQQALLQFSFLRLDDRLPNEHLGTFALREMSNFGISNSSVETASLYEAVRTVGTRICRSLSSFDPTFPLDMEMPRLGTPPGRPNGDGTYSMKPKEYEEWRAAQDSWNERFNAVWEYNSSIRDARSAAANYIRESAWHCACVALRIESESCPSAPERPDISAMIKTRPELR